MRVSPLPGEVAGDPEQCRIWSAVMRRDLLQTKLKELEGKLAQIMVLDSFDRGLIKARLNFRVWAEYLGLRDEKSLRPGWCKRYLKALNQYHIFDVNELDATYEPRPAASSWSTSLGWHQKPPGKIAGELGFSTERPLSEAMTELSRDEVLAARVPVRDSRSLFSIRLAALQAAWQRNASQAEIDGLQAEFEEACRGIYPVTQPAQPPAPGNLPGKAAHAAPPGNLPGKSVRVAAAMAWVESQDKAGALKEAWVRAQWRELCERNPGYVLKKLCGALEDYERRIGEEYISGKNRGKPRKPLPSPLAWLSGKARCDGEMVISYCQPGHGPAGPGPAAFGGISRNETAAK